ncbi:MAG: FtsH protease activity modulator HflK [Candidatus Brocadiae bacterium]|nr:FtsH protease activity modulator HflK [Candidatus Brocadiia bacterium]
MNERSTHAPDQPKHPRRRRWPVVLAVFLAAYLATGLYSVRTKERAVVQRCGRALEHVRRPDLYFGLPYGIDRVTRLKVLETKRVGVGMTLADRALGRRAEPLTAECLTGDRNLVRVSAVVHYTIKDPRAYMFHVADVEALVRNVASAELTRIVSGMGVDDVLTKERDSIRSQARDAIQATLERVDAGVSIRSVTLPSDGVTPPAEVADAFADVTSALGDRERLKSIAEGYANRVTAQARGQKQRILIESEAYADEVVKMAQGDAGRFLAEAEKLGEARDLTLRRLVLETMEEVLPRVRKIVLDPHARRSLDLGIIEAKE